MPPDAGGVHAVERIDISARGAVADAVGSAHDAAAPALLHHLALFTKKVMLAEGGGGEGGGGDIGTFNVVRVLDAAVQNAPRAREVPHQLLASVSSSVVASGAAGVRLETRALPSAAPAVHFLHTVLRFLADARRVEGGVNVYHLAACTRRPAILAAAVATFLLQTALVAYCALSLWKDGVSLELEMLPLALVAMVATIPIARGLAADARLLQFVFRAGPRATGVLRALRAMDLMVNIVFTSSIPVLSFLVLISSEGFLDAVLNAVALLFIPTIDDEIVPYLDRDAVDAVLRALAEHAAQLHFAVAPAVLGAANIGDALAHLGPFPHLFRDVRIGSLGFDVDAPLSVPMEAPFCELRLEAIVARRPDEFWLFPDVVLDLSGRRPNYLFSRIRFSVRPPATHPECPSASLSFVELHRLGTDEVVTFGAPGGNDAHELDGVLAVWHINAGGVLYGMCVLQFGSLDDVQAYFRFWSLEVPFSIGGVRF